MTGDWKDEAACKGRDDIYFSPDPGHLAEARAICMGCPVFDPCFEAGLHEVHGTWAGTSERERARIRRDRGIVLPEPVDPAAHPMTHDLEDIA